MSRLKQDTFVTRLKDNIEYFEDNSTLRRFGHVITMSKTVLFKRLFWFVSLSACCLGAGAILKGALSLYAQDAVSYSVETDYLEWDTPFPAVTLCEQFDLALMSKSLKRYNLNGSFTGFFRDVTFWKSCRSCNNCQLNKTCVEDFQRVVDGIRARCEDTLTTCWWNDDPFPCCERFKPIKTQYGTCFVFNSRDTGTEDISIVNRRIGLPTLKFTSILSITISVHSPDEIMIVSSENNISPCDSLPLYSKIEVIVNAEQTINDVSVEGIVQGSRDCLFYDERPDEPEQWPFPRYSYSACIWLCNAKQQADLCNCTHHFMPRIENIPICGINGLRCLSKNDESLALTECVCPMDCEEITYKIVHASCQRFAPKKIQEHGVTETIGTVRLGQLPSLRMRRHAIRDMLGLVVDFGGVLGVFFGASLLSFIEIIYIFCLRKSQ